MIADAYVANANVINFDMIYSQCRGTKQENTNRFYQTVKKTDLDNMPDKEKDRAVSTCLRSSRPDVFVEKKLAFDHFLTSFRN